MLSNNWWLTQPYSYDKLAAPSGVAPTERQVRRLTNSAVPQVVEIPLTQGKVALVDAEDYQYLAQFNWQAVKDRSNWYAVRRDGYSHVRMHREIMGMIDGNEVDHKDGDGLNNCKSNLRVGTRQQNAANQKRSTRSKTGYIGVSLSVNHVTTPYRVYCAHKFIGMFATAEEAARAYDKAVKEKYGEFAKTNF